MYAVYVCVHVGVWMCVDVCCVYVCVHEGVCTSVQMCMCSHMCTYFCVHVRSCVWLCLCASATDPRRMTLSCVIHNDDFCRGVALLSSGVTSQLSVQARASSGVTRANDSGLGL